MNLEKKSKLSKVNVDLEYYNFEVLVHKNYQPSQVFLIDSVNAKLLFGLVFISINCENGVGIEIYNVEISGFFYHSDFT